MTTPKPDWHEVWNILFLIQTERLKPTDGFALLKAQGLTPQKAFARMTEALSPAGYTMQR